MIVGAAARNDPVDKVGKEALVWVFRSSSKTRMQQIILHAGQPKTGTSAVQRFCARNRDALLRFGYLYPVTGCGREGNHGPLMRLLEGQPPRPNHVDARERFPAEIQEHSPQTVVLSAEYLSAHFRGAPPNSPVVGYFASFNVPITVIMYVRPAAEQANSSYVQHVKSFHPVGGLREYVTRHVHRTSDALLSYLGISSLPRVETKFLPYDDQVRRTGVVRHFLAAGGLSEDELSTLKPEQRINEAIGPIAVAVARDTLARIGSAAGELTDLQCRALRAALLELIENEEAEAPFQGIDDALYEEIEAVGTNGRETFARAAWGRSWGEVFPPVNRKPCNVFDPATAHSPAIERFERMRTALWAAAEAVMADERLARVRAWDKKNQRRYTRRDGAFGLRPTV
jgi:hypothetical protein